MRKEEGRRREEGEEGEEEAARSEMCRSQRKMPRRFAWGARSCGEEGMGHQLPSRLPEPWKTANWTPACACCCGPPCGRPISV